MITDIIMPNIDGIKMITELLNQPLNFLLSLFLVINGQWPQDLVEMLGVRGSLQKPFTHQQLQEVVKLALS